MARSAVVWLDPEQAAWVGEVAQRAELRITSAGTPARGGLGRAAELLGGAGGSRGPRGGAGGGATFDDLRSVLASVEADVALLAAADDFGADLESPDGEALRAFRARGGQVLTLEPVPAAYTRLEVDGAGVPGVPGGGGEAPLFVPRLRSTRGVADALEAMESFGAPRFAGVRAVSRAGEGSLGARLVDAIDALLAFIGEPDQVYAAYAPARHTRGGAGGGAVHALPGESLRGLHGEVTVSMAYADGRAASVFASDQGGRWSRRITIVAESGQMDAGERAALWRGQDADVADEALGEASVVEAVGEQLGRVLDGAGAAGASGPPMDHASVLAVAGAALLSVRTGEAESPRTILRMARG
jgi:hypothetical protein